MGHTLTNLLSHIVFGTKERMPLITADLRARLFSYLGGIVRNLGGTVIAINGTASHVHILAELKPSTSVSEAVRVLKSNSSRWVHELGARFSKFGWQTGYAAFSVSRSNLKGVARYIDQQEEHHKRMDFRREFVALLRKHGVQYDERYVWD